MLVTQARLLEVAGKGPTDQWHLPQRFEIARVPQATGATPHLQFASFGIRCGSDQVRSALSTVVRLTLSSCAMRALGTP